MKRCILVASLCILVCPVALGQWVETTVVLPDSLGSLEWPRALLFDSLNQTVYLGGEFGRCIIGIDPQTTRPRYRIGVGVDVRAFCLNTTDNKVYTADRLNNAVTVIAGATGQVVTRIPVGAGPFALAWNADANRVYCVNYSGNSVSVIDGAADTVVATVAVGAYPYALCWAGPANKVYCTSSAANSVSVIDCQTNQVVRTIPVGTAPLSLVYNPISNKVYSGDCFSNTISIISTITDSVVATLDAPGAPRGFCFNSTNNKVYGGCEDDELGVIIDGTTDSVIATPYMEHCAALAYSSVGSRVYGVGHYGYVFCLDGAGDTLIADGSAAGDMVAVCYDPVSDQVFCANNSDAEPAVFVFDGKTLELNSVFGSRARPQAILYNPAANKLYSADGLYNTVTAIDGTNNAIVANIPVGVSPSLLALDAADNKLYCSTFGAYGQSDSTFSVIDCAGDTVVRRVPFGFPPSAMAWSPALNRLYCIGNYDSTVTVYDCAADSVIGEVTVGPRPFALCLDTAGTRVYTLNLRDYTLSAVDAVADTLLCTIGLGSQPMAMANNPASDYLYCALGNIGRVLVIGGTPPAVVDTIYMTGGDITDLCYVPHENKLYLTNQSTSKITVIDCNTNSVIKQIPASASSGPLCCDTANRWVYVADAVAHTVSVIDAHRDTIVAVLPAGEVTALAWNATDLRTYAANLTAGTITVIRDSLHVGIADRGTRLAARRPHATIVRGVLFLPRGENGDCPAKLGTDPSQGPVRFPGTVPGFASVGLSSFWALLDISGRKVLDLKPGANDVRSLAPGVYFIRSAPSTVSVRKVIIAR